MKKTERFIGLFIWLVSILLIAACQVNTAPTPVPTAAAGEQLRSRTAPAGQVTALGTILPARSLKLGFATGGSLLAVEVQVGTELKAGDPVAALDTTRLEMNVREARDGLALAQALLAQARTGPGEESLSIAEAEYERAQDRYEQAQSAYEQTLTQIHPEQIAIARAEVDAALARYEQVKAGASPEELAAAQAHLQRAEIARQRAQAAYDRVAGRADVGASPESAALQEATVDYQAASAEVERLKNLPSPAALQEAQARLEQAQARLRLAQIEPDEVEVIASGGALAVARAQAELAALGPRPEDVAVVEAQVQQAQTALERSQLALSQAQLQAPFGGIVSAIYLHPGEWAAAGAPVVELLDTSHWLVETRNIGELAIGQVKVGQEAIVQVMAFRGEELRGRVVAISPIAVVQQGDTTYTVSIELEPTDLNLRPGMNAEVEIVTE